MATGLTRAEKEQLRQALGCTPAELTSRLRLYEAAAREEYLSMMLGKRVYTRGQDIREYRLFLIIKHVLKGELPRERLISNIFQTTASQSRTLLRAVMSKYQYLLRPVIEATLEGIVTRATQTGANGSWQFGADSENVIDALNRELSQLNPVFDQVTRVARTVGTYEISNASYLALRARFGL